jgi:hypothetical protein
MVGTTLHIPYDVRMLSFQVSTDLKPTKKYGNLQTQQTTVPKLRKNDLQSIAVSCAFSSGDPVAH